MGYQILKEGELIKAGDEYYSFGDWKSVPEQWNNTVVSYNVDNTFSRLKIQVRREVKHHCTQCESKKNNPWCSNCKEKDCLVELDGTCEMLRKYLQCETLKAEVDRLKDENEKLKEYKTMYEGLCK